MFFFLSILTPALTAGIVLSSWENYRLLHSFKNQCNKVCSGLQTSKRQIRKTNFSLLLAKWISIVMATSLTTFCICIWTHDFSFICLSHSCIIHVSMWQPSCLYWDTHGLSHHWIYKSQKQTIFNLVRQVKHIYSELCIVKNNEWI